MQCEYSQCTTGLILKIVLPNSLVGVSCKDQIVIGMNSHCMEPDTIPAACNRAILCQLQENINT